MTEPTDPLAEALQRTAEQVHVWHYRDGGPVTEFTECGWTVCRTNAVVLAAYNAPEAVALRAAREEVIDAAREAKDTGTLTHSLLRALATLEALEAKASR